MSLSSVMNTTSLAIVRSSLLKIKMTSKRNKVLKTNRIIGWFRFLRFRVQYQQTLIAETIAQPRTTAHINHKTLSIPYQDKQGINTVIRFSNSRTTQVLTFLSWNRLIMQIYRVTFNKIPSTSKIQSKK